MSVIPTASATLLILSTPDISKSLAFDIRILLRDSIAVYPVCSLKTDEIYCGLRKNLVDNSFGNSYSPDIPLFLRLSFFFVGY